MYIYIHEYVYKYNIYICIYVYIYLYIYIYNQYLMTLEEHYDLKLIAISYVVNFYHSSRSCFIKLHKLIDFIHYQ